MQPKAIIYCSKHGSTKGFAEQLGNKCNLPVICIDHVTGYSFQNTPVYFCGWVCNGKIKGLNKATKAFMCMKIYAVGMCAYNEGYELKLKYHNKILNPEFHYVQTNENLKMNFLERFYFNFVKRHTNEYTI